MSLRYADETFERLDYQLRHLLPRARRGRAGELPHVEARWEGGGDVLEEGAVPASTPRSRRL